MKHTRQPTVVWAVLVLAVGSAIAAVVGQDIWSAWLAIGCGASALLIDSV